MKWTADSVGPGWKHLVQPLLDLCELYQVPVLQVKEKFGGLRFYHAGGDKIEYLVSAAEAMSYHTCEECGTYGIDHWDTETGKPIYKAKTKGDGWILTLCDPCREAKLNKTG